ncbi:MAG TPA: 2-succinyl-5-enolpyruvyl-6-hydroxy-3-cyclohexene-1-carboxylic-acid synthase [Opitutaceae bacterium]|nr:2-succinyl-5-enolpyruvyl-6-hydroxy-3-cyclohexene-1-carboxylic-acid synthase [Opitutaceae bacterium]
MAPLDTRNVNSLWCGVLAESLFRSGVRWAVISPGSRSAPLTFAFARHPGIEAIPVLDERSAAFFALGLARRDGRPVALICTSGTAAANYFPAVVEAHESGVPLLILTADRPPEMRACASGQTIEQQRLYGSYVRFHHEFAVPELDRGLLRYLRQSAAHAAARCLAPAAGPVHLNAPFRDPLPPVPDGRTEAWAAGIDWEAFFGHLAPAEPAPPRSRAPALPATSRGLIVAGPVPAQDPAAYAAEVAALAKKLGWPVLADALSPARHQRAGIPGLVTAYDAILRHPDAAERLRPEAVVCLGNWPTSKVLRGWLEAADAPTWLASRRSDNRDALHGRTRQVLLSVGELARGLARGRPAGAYRREWIAAERSARRILERRLAAEGALFEPKAAWLLARLLPPGTPVFLASSMPVRDAEYVWAPGRRLRPFFNRGANGIDGTLSSALGAAHGGPPAVLLTGDLALLHDSNGFLIAPKFRGGLTVVLINNRGGGIFEHLPVAQFEPPFEEYFATPQRADFGRLCAAYGAEHVRVRDWAHFERLLSRLPARGLRVLELRTDRRRDAAARKELLRAAGEARSR